MSKLEKVREFSKLMSKKEPSRWGEKLKQSSKSGRTLSVQRTAVRPMWLEPGGADGGRRLAS